METGYSYLVKSIEAKRLIFNNTCQLLSVSMHSDFPPEFSFIAIDPDFGRITVLAIMGHFSANPLDSSVFNVTIQEDSKAELCYPEMMPDQLAYGLEFLTLKEFLNMPIDKTIRPAPNFDELFSRFSQS